VKQDPLDTSARNLKPLPWARSAGEALRRYRERQPGPQDLERVAACQTTPEEFLDNPQLRVRAMEHELAWMFGNLMTVLEETLDRQTACKVAYAAGRRHGKHWLGTFLSGNGLAGGPEAMAMWQDTGHSAAGHLTALFAHYDEELVETVSTDDSFNTGTLSPVAMAFFDGLIDGNKAADPGLSYVEELTRERSDGALEVVHRYWYREDEPSAPAKT
jgi:hypothetical protein